MATNDELEVAIEAFLDDAETVFDEYEQGYMDADAALTNLQSAIEDFVDEYEG